MERGCPQNLIENLLPEIKFTERESKLLKKTTRRKKKYCHSRHNTNPQCLLERKLEWKTGILYNWLKNHLSIPYKKGKSLKYMLFRAKKKVNKGFHAGIDVRSVNPCSLSHNRFESVLAIILAGCVLYNKCSQLSR